MSVSKLGKCASAGLRPVAPRRPSAHSKPLFSSCNPLVTVSRFQPSSCSARYATPSKSSLTVRAMNSRRAYPLSDLAVSCSSFFRLSISPIPVEDHMNLTVSTVLFTQFPWNPLHHCARRTSCRASPRRPNRSRRRLGRRRGANTDADDDVTALQAPRKAW